MSFPSVLYHFVRHLQRVYLHMTSRLENIADLRIFSDFCQTDFSILSRNSTDRPEDLCFVITRVLPAGVFQKTSPYSERKLVAHLQCG